MRLASIILAMALAVGGALAQAPTARTGRAPAPASASSRTPETLPPDSFAIPANSGGQKGNTAEPKAAADAAAAANQTGVQSLWAMVQRAGWVIYPLGFLSIVLVMLLLTFLFTL